MPLIRSARAAWTEVCGRGMGRLPVGLSALIGILSCVGLQLILDVAPRRVGVDKRVQHEEAPSTGGCDS